MAMTRNMKIELGSLPGAEIWARGLSWNEEEDIYKKSPNLWTISAKILGAKSQSNLGTGVTRPPPHYMWKMSHFLLCEERWEKLRLASNVRMWNLMRTWNKNWRMNNEKIENVKIFRDKLSRTDLRTWRRNFRGTFLAASKSPPKAPNSLGTPRPITHLG